VRCLSLGEIDWLAFDQHGLEEGSSLVIESDGVRTGAMVGREQAEGDGEDIGTLCCLAWADVLIIWAAPLQEGWSCLGANLVRKSVIEFGEDEEFSSGAEYRSGSSERGQGDREPGCRRSSCSKFLKVDGH